MADKNVQAGVNPAEPQEAKPKGEKLVTLTLHVDYNNPNQKDEQAFLNGRQFIIKPGETVKVPVGVAEIFTNRNRMLKTISDYNKKHVKA